MEKEKHMSSEVHLRADSRSVPACVSTGRSDMVVAIIGAASPILNVVHAANKDAAAHSDPYGVSTICPWIQIGVHMHLGSIEIKKWVKDHGMKHVDVTNSPMPNVEPMISTLGLTNFLSFGYHRCNTIACHILSIILEEGVDTSVSLVLLPVD
nr:hypothetical protein [Tanacetum cinerariifolium]